MCIVVVAGQAPKSSISSSLSHLEQIAAQEVWKTNFSPVFLIDCKGIIHYASPSCAGALGLNQESFHGKSLLDYVSDPPYFEESLYGALSVLDTEDIPFLEIHGHLAHKGAKNKPANIQLKLSKARSAPHLFLVALAFHCSPIGANIGYIPAHIYLEKIIENINAILWVKSLKTNRMIYVSDNFESFYGVSKEDYFRDPDILSKQLHPEDREKFSSANEAHNFSQSESTGFRFQHKNGEWRHATAYHFLIQDPSGMADTMAGVTIEDTHLYNAQLEIENQKEKLSRQNQDLYHANKNLEEFTHIAFHDLNMPLRVINTHFQILEDHYLKKQDSECLSLLHSIYTSIHRMKSLIDSMMKKSHFNAVKSGRPEMICLRSLLNSQVLPLFMTALNPDLEINILRMTYLYAEEDHLITLFKNLIENGIKYNHQENKTITINARRLKHGAVISISDNGIGLPQDQQSEIFTFGTRGENAATAQGFGIGLAACKRIVDLYQGKIWVKSKEGQGATFYVYVPDLPLLYEKALEDQGWAR